MHQVRLTYCDITFETLSKQGACTKLGALKVDMGKLENNSDRILFFFMFLSQNKNKIMIYGWINRLPNEISIYGSRTLPKNGILFWKNSNLCKMGYHSFLDGSIVS